MIGLISLLFWSATADYLTTWTWTHQQCQFNGNPVRLVATQTNCSSQNFNATGCTCNLYNGVYNCTMTECRSIVPSLTNVDNGYTTNVPLEDWNLQYPTTFNFHFEQTNWLGDSTCNPSNPPISYTAYMDGSCVNGDLTESSTRACQSRNQYSSSGQYSTSGGSGYSTGYYDNTVYYYIFQYGQPNCQGGVLTTLTNSRAQCVQTQSSPVIYTTYDCTPACFHESTQISYRGEKYTLASLQTNPASQPCAIPHVVVTDGVKISTTCKNPLRLSNTHLVYTAKGLIRAVDVAVGDLLFADLEEKTPCEVLSVEEERQQKYFGLNCEDSDVLANGHKTSTFGNYHTLPAAWMKYASKVFGVHTASAIGDAFASVFPH